MSASPYRDHLRQGLVGFAVPEHLHEGLIEYLAARRPTGGFLQAVLANDLRGAVGRADEQSGPALPNIIMFLVNHAPASSWGTQEQVRTWLTTTGPVPEPYD